MEKQFKKILITKYRTRFAAPVYKNSNLYNTYEPIALGAMNEAALTVLKELKKQVYRGHPAHNYVTEDQINSMIKKIKQKK